MLRYTGRTIGAEWSSVRKECVTYISQGDRTHEVVTGSSEQDLEYGLLSRVLSNEHAVKIGKREGRGRYNSVRIYTHLSVSPSLAKNNSSVKRRCVKQWRVDRC